MTKASPARLAEPAVRSFTNSAPRPSSISGDRMGPSRHTSPNFFPRGSVSSEPVQRALRPISPDRCNSEEAGRTRIVSSRNSGPGERLYQGRYPGLSGFGMVDGGGFARHDARRDRGLD